jgi:hypothetical protein
LGAGSITQAGDLILERLTHQEKGREEKRFA